MAETARDEDRCRILNGDGDALAGFSAAMFPTSQNRARLALRLANRQRLAPPPAPRTNSSSYHQPPESTARGCSGPSCGLAPG